MLSYSKLWILLNSRGLKKTDLLTVVSSPTLAKLGKNENVNTSVIEKICDYLNCQPADIMENITKEQLIKTGQEFNEKLLQVFQLLQMQTDKSSDELLEEFMQQAPQFFEALKNGETDLIGLNEFIEKNKKTDE